MQRLILSVTLFLIFNSVSYGQIPEYDTLNDRTDRANSMIKDMQGFADSIFKIYQATDRGLLNGTLNTGLHVMSKPYFDKFIGKYFSYTATNKAGLPDGNSVSITPSTNSTRLQANLAKKSNSVIYNAGFSADFSDNIANVITARDASANTSFYLNLSFLRRQHSLIEFDANEAYNDNQKKIHQVRQFKNSLNLKYQVTYEEDLKTYETTRHQLDTILAMPVWVQNIDTIKIRIIKIKNDLSAAIAKVKSYGLNEWQALYHLNGLDTLMTRQLKDSLTTILDTMELNNSAWTKFRFSWFSGGITYTRQQYKTYDSLLAFTKRINDLPFNNISLTLGFNYFSQRSEADLKTFKGVESFYFNATYAIVNDINYSHLDENDLLTLTQINNADTIYQFQKTSKVRDISRQEKKINWLHTMSLQTTLPLGKSNFMGLNTGISASYGKFTTPVYNGKLGLLFRFISSDDQKSKLNFEIFVQFNDWNDSIGSGNSTWQRKSIGFNTTIPFNKLFF